MAAGAVGIAGAGPKMSPEALRMIETRVRFTDYLPPEVWPTCRNGFRDTMIADSDKAKEELLSSVEEETLGGCRVLRLIPKTYADAHKVIIYCHGGALTLGNPDCTLQFPAPVSHKTGFQVISIDYPLAPYVHSDDPHPAHTAVLNVYEALLKDYRPSEIGVLADSAGGNLAFGMSQLARDKGLPLPGAIVTYAPWVDLEQTSEAYSTKERIDQTLVLTPQSLASARDAAFGKTDTYSSYVSPSKGDYEGFGEVSIAIYTAGRDLLKDEGEALAEKLRSKAKRVDSSCKEGMWHGFQEHYGLPEAEESAQAASTFFQHNLS